MKTILLCLAIAASAASALAHGATRSAGFVASFTVTEACVVRSATAQPRVACQLASPYQVARSAAAPETAAPDADGVWTVTF